MADIWTDEPLQVFGSSSGNVDTGAWDIGQSGSPGTGGLFGYGGILGSGVSGTQLSSALGDLNKSLQQTNQNAQQQGFNQSQPRAGTATSGTSPGSAAGIQALAQMLMQRANQYYDQTQPVALPRPGQTGSARGLLGL